MAQIIRKIESIPHMGSKGYHCSPESSSCLDPPPAATVCTWSHLVLLELKMVLGGGFVGNLEP